MANRISEMTEAEPLDGTELLEVSQLSPTVTITATTISANATTNGFADDGLSFLSAGFAAGDRIKVEGFTDPANNLFAASVSDVTAGTMAIASPEGDLIVNEAAGDTVTITKWVTRRASAQELADLGGGGGGGIDGIDIEKDGALVQLDATLINFTGAGVTVTDDGGYLVEVAIPGGGGGGGGAWSLQFGPLDNEPPASNFATLDTRNSRAVLDFDATTAEAAIFTGVLPVDYAGGGLTVTIFCALTTATSGTVGWDVAIERINASGLDIDSDSFATAVTVTAVTVPSTSGQVLAMSVDLDDGAEIDSLAAGELFRIRIRRDVANDTATGDAELLRVMVREQ